MGQKKEKVSEKKERTIQGEEQIPFWRDGRILGILIQIIFVLFFTIAAAAIFRNINDNLEQLGPAQFICRQGSPENYSLRCAFDFLSADSQFAIQESMIDYTPKDSYWRAIGVGILNTLKVAVIGILLTTLLGVFTGIARLSKNWLVRNLAKAYIDLMRNTPLLLQLFFLYFVILLGLPSVQEATQLFNFPIYLSQRGINYPTFTYMSSFGIWAAFLLLALIQGQLIWFFLGIRERETGRQSNRFLWTAVGVFVVATFGWYVASGMSNNESLLASKLLRIREYDDLSGLIERRLGLSDLNEIETSLKVGTISAEQVAEASLTVCTLKGMSSEVNFTTQLTDDHIPYLINRFDRPDQAIAAYEAGDCEILVAERTILAAERSALIDSEDHYIVTVPERPLRVTVPQLEGFNFVGGGKMSLEFSAILFGLVLYTAAFVAEIVRAGIQSVSKGQSEAAYALGLNEGQRLRLIVLPQALRVIIPPLTSQYLNLTKNSSLALAVAYPDLYRTIDTIINQSGRSIQLVLILGATYLSFSLIISFFLNWYNRQIALVER